MKLIMFFSLICKGWEKLTGSSILLLCFMVLRHRVRSLGNLVNRIVVLGEAANKCLANFLWRGQTSSYFLTYDVFRFVLTLICRKIGIKTGCDALCCSWQHVCYIDEYNCLSLYLYGNGSLRVLFLIITLNDSNNWNNVEDMCNGWFL